MQNKTCLICAYPKPLRDFPMRVSRYSVEWSGIRRECRIKRALKRSRATSSPEKRQQSRSKYA